MYREAGFERIARFLLTEQKVHTWVKLNPTLLGKKQVLEILNKNLGYDIDISDATFEHDLGYDRAINLLHSLQEIADERKLYFGVKLSNTPGGGVIGAGGIGPGMGQRARQQIRIGQRRGTDMPRGQWRWPAIDPVLEEEQGLGSGNDELGTAGRTPVGRDEL